MTDSLPRSMQHNANIQNPAESLPQDESNGDINNVESLQSQLAINSKHWLQGSSCRKKATVWVFFISNSLSIDPHTADELLLRCIVCNSVMKWNGTSSLINHVSLKHTRVFAEYKSSILPEVPRVRKRQEHDTSDIRKHIKKPSYGKSSIVQKKFVDNLVLLACKDLLPISLVDSKPIRKLVHDIDPRISLPNRKTFTNNFVSAFDAGNKKRNVIDCLGNASFITLTYNLWMSRGSNEIFSVIAHWLDNNLNFQSRHLQMVQMDSISGNTIAEKLGQMLQDLGIKNKLVACVTDWGSNLKNCTGALSGMVTCDYLDINLPYNGYCWAHFMSTCLKKALDLQLCEGIDYFDIKKLQSRLQKSINWTKTSGKGARIWEKACMKANLPPIKLYTPVKTRFGSFLLMLKQVLTYKDAIHFCYTDEENTSNSSREPTAFEWTMESF